jgi:hypothetical protein
MRNRGTEETELILEDWERHLLLDKVALPLPVAVEIKNAQCREGKCACRFARAEIAAIRDAIGGAIPRFKNQIVRRNLNRLQDRITKTLHESSDGEPGDPEWRSDMSPELREALNETLRKGPYSSLDELNAAVADVTCRFNRTPREEMGGLSPIQISRLLYPQWESPESSIRFNRGITLEDLKSARILTNARLFLTQAKSGVKSTAKGNLNRRFVEAMLDEMALIEGYAEEVRWFNKVINEADLFPLHTLRIILELGGLIRKTKGTFKTTKKGQKLLAEEKAGELYALLFLAQFQKFNLAYMTFGPENSPVQGAIAYSFYQLWKRADTWQEAETLAPILLLPAVIEQLEIPDHQSGVTSLCSLRIFRPLEEFGLLERRELPSEKKWDKPYEIRKTPLFDRFLRFEL